MQGPQGAAVAEVHALHLPERPGLALHIRSMKRSVCPGLVRAEPRNPAPGSAGLCIYTVNISGKGRVIFTP